MKRLVLVALIVAGFGWESKVQEKKEGKKDMPPTPVSAAFGKAFPGSSKVKWEKEKTDYEVGFMVVTKEKSKISHGSRRTFLFRNPDEYSILRAQQS